MAMILDYLKEKKEQVSVVLLVVSAIFGILALVKVAGFFITSARAENIVKKAIAQSTEAASCERGMGHFR